MEGEVRRELQQSVCVKPGGGAVMVSGCISSCGVGGGLIGVEKHHSILIQHAAPSGICLIKLGIFRTKEVVACAATAWMFSSCSPDVPLLHKMLAAHTLTLSLADYLSGQTPPSLLHAGLIFPTTPWMTNVFLFVSLLLLSHDVNLCTDLITTTTWQHNPYMKTISVIFKLHEKLILLRV